METQMQSVRGARGVQLEDVWGAADVILRRGERPTIERIRLQLGRGSPNTVGPMLDSWYGTLAKRLTSVADEAVPAQAEGSVSLTDSNTLPPQVLRAAKALWGRAQQLALEHAQSEVAKDRLALAELEQGLEAKRIQLESEQQRLDERASALEAALFAKDQQISQAGRQLEELKHILHGKTEEAELLRSDLSKQRIAMDAMRQFTQAKDEEHRKERERLEQRATAQERRMLAEIDRARQATKSAESQLEAALKQGTLQLHEAGEREAVLKEKLQQVELAHANLNKEWIAAKDQIHRLHTAAAAQLAHGESASTEAIPRIGKIRPKPPTIPKRTRLKRAD